MVDVHGCVLQPILSTYSFTGIVWCIHIGVGFCVARSDYNGQCEGLSAWDG